MKTRAKTKRPKTVALTVRTDPAVIADLDELAAKLSLRLGNPQNRADLARMALARGVVVLKNES